MRFLPGTLGLVGLLTAGCVDAAPDLGREGQPIIQGTATSAYPAVGMIYFDGAFCSATVIGERTVLTAAHCVDDVDPASGELRFGPDGFDPERSIPIVEAVPHPGYDAEESWFRRLPYDIAVLRLSEPAGVAPVAVNDRDLRDLFTWPATERAVGYGYSELYEEDLTGRKRYADLQIHYVTPEALVLEEDVQSMCYGDSGGPHLLPLDGQDIIVAVTSLVTTSCTSESLHTRVDVHAAGFVYPYLDAWEGACRLDGACVTDGCRTPDPDCAPCGIDGVCTEGCVTEDLDCPPGAAPVAPVEDEDTTDDEEETPFRTGGCSMGGSNGDPPAAAVLVLLLLAMLRVTRARRSQRTRRGPEASAAPAPRRRSPAAAR